MSIGTLAGGCLSVAYATDLHNTANSLSHSYLSGGFQR